MLTTFNTLDLITRPSSDYEIGFNLGGTTGRALLMEVACAADMTKVPNARREVGDELAGPFHPLNVNGAQAATSR